MVFTYHELITYWKELKIWCRTLLIISIFVLSAYIVLVNSRAGILVMIVISLVCIVCLAITKRSLQLGLGFALVLCLSFGGSTRVFPSYTNRISKTIKNVEEVEGNGRLRLYHCNWQLICKSLIIGYGIGDYYKVQLDNYRSNGYSDTADGDYNAHNQYMESLLQAGMFGLIALLLFLFTPLLVAFRYDKKHMFLLCLISGIVSVNLLFESMLERQMGLLFRGCSL